MARSIRPGDVLAGRYRLIDLLSESGGGRFWRAHDRVLERHVALHVIPEDDERAESLMDAARRSATVHDRRLLRVLDADRADGWCFVINEWGSGDSLDALVAAEGPLDPRRAAWLASEVAGAIASGHRAGVSHGRLIPENVLVDHAGAVRLIGFAVDAALHGLPAGRPSADVTALGGLLYCALTGRWPGTERSAVAPAPLVQGRVLRPRQVRAGIPRPLDLLCDELINPYAGGQGSRLRDAHDLASAQGVADYLVDFVGDTTGLAEAEAAAAEQREGVEIVDLPSLADPPARPSTSPDPTPDPAPDPSPQPAARPAAETQPPTEAGLPIFDDESDDVSWLTARSPVAPPPPPFEDPPERPLFATGERRTPRASRPVPPTPTPPLPEPVRARGGDQPPGGFWPWDTGTGSLSAATGELEEVPGRSWLRLAAAIGVAVLLLVAIVVAYNLGRGRTPLGAVPDDDAGTPTPRRPASSAPARVLTGITATDLDPQGRPASENPELAPLAVDGKPDTAWRTQTYKQNFGPEGLKSGVGLVLDLGAVRAVSRVDLSLVGSPSQVSLYLTDQAPTDVANLDPVVEVSVDDESGQASLPAGSRGRYLTVWLTSIPTVSDGFRGGIAEVTVRG